jgi:hypothetical protein
MRIARFFAACAFGLVIAGVAREATSDEPLVANARKIVGEHALRDWLTNMVSYHRFTPEEVRAATGLTLPEIDAALKRFDIVPGRVPPRKPTDPLVVLPYPGGRHPRIGFLDGAVHPQRETKVSVFTPWADGGYVVADVPEAIWSNLGLTYLAHTHVDTIWTKQNVKLEPLEWTRLPSGELQCERTLPNGIRFGTKVRPTPTEVRMEMWLHNGTEQALTGLRVQNCVMLKGARGFEPQTNDNKIFDAPYTACRDSEGDHWVISAWEPCQRAWGNAPCPCLHSDPQFPDCPPGETRHVRGWLSFYEGSDVRGEFRRIDSLGWRKPG